MGDALVPCLQVQPGSPERSYELAFILVHAHCLQISVPSIATMKLIWAIALLSMVVIANAGCAKKQKDYYVDGTEYRYMSPFSSAEKCRSKCNSDIKCWNWMWQSSRFGSSCQHYGQDVSVYWHPVWNVKQYAGSCA